MTIRELKKQLSEYDENSKVLFAQEGEMYGEGSEITGFYVQHSQPKINNKNDELSIEHIKCTPPNIVIIGTES